MKLFKYKFFVMLTLLMTTGLAMHGANLTLENFTIEPGQTKNVDLIISGESISFAGFQGDIETADGIQVTAITFAEDFVHKENYSLVTNLENPNKALFLVFLKNNNQFLDYFVGPFLSLTIKASENAITDNGILSLKNVKVSDPNGGKITDVENKVEDEPVGNIKVPVSEIKLNALVKTIKDSENFQMTATILPDKATDKTIIWESSDPSVATISNKGLITGKMAGITTITCKAQDGSGVTVKCQITVIPTEATSISLNKQQISLITKEKEQLITTILPNTTTNKTITWKSSNAKAVSVSLTGIVTALSVGTSTITATCGNVSATCEVTVIPISSDKVEVVLTPQDDDGAPDGSVSIVAGQNKQLKMDISHDTSYTGEIITIWSSSNSNIVSVDNVGKISVIKYSEKPVTVTATVKYGTNYTVSGSIKVNTVQANISNVSVSSSKTQLKIGESVQLEAVASPSLILTGDVSYDWKSENQNVLSISPNGTITGKAPGSVKVTATASNIVSSVEGEIVITVIPTLPSLLEIETISLEKYKNKHILKVGETLDFSATVKPENATYKEVVWSIDDSNVASIEEREENNEMRLTAKKLGKATVNIKVKEAPEILATYEITVENLLLGDANDNGKVNISDPLAVANDIVASKNNSESANAKFCFINADINFDKEIDVVDQALITDMLYGQYEPYNPTGTRTLSENYSADYLKVENFIPSVNTKIGFSLENASNYIILQAYIHIPDGMNVVDVKKGNQAKNHSFVYNITDDNILKVDIFVIPNSPFEANDENLFTIFAEAQNDCRNIEVSNIIVADLSRNKHMLEYKGGENVSTTGIISATDKEFSAKGLRGEIILENGEGKNISIYTLSGAIIKNVIPASAQERIIVQPGIYIVTSKASPYKVIVK